MNDIYIQLIILTVLVWLFEGKIFPQIIIIFLALIMLMNQQLIIANIGILILYAVIMLYSALSISMSKESEV